LILVRGESGYSRVRNSNSVNDLPTVIFNVLYFNLQFRQHFKIFWKFNDFFQPGYQALSIRRL
jgi:hypothetical protein